MQVGLYYYSLADLTLEPRGPRTPERPHRLLFFSTFGPPHAPWVRPPGAKTSGGGGEGGGLRCAEPTYFSRVDAKRPTLAGLVPI
jgi:hypothetical protein